MASASLVTKLVPAAVQKALLVAGVELLFLGEVTRLFGGGFGGGAHILVIFI